MGYALSVKTLFVGLAVALGLALLQVSPEAEAAGDARGVAAVVSTDGALVFVAPDPDSEAIAQLPEGQGVRVSKGTTSGPEKFRKVRVNNRIGYILDIDVVLGEAAAAKGKTGKNKKANAKKPKKKEHKVDTHEPMYFCRYFGVLLGQSEFKEGINNVDSSTNFLIYGLKITGPDTLFPGPVLDFNLALHNGAPDYYGALSATPPSGFVMLIDTMVQVPFVQAQNGTVYVEAGPLLAITHFSVVNSGRAMDLSSVNVGVSTAVGAGFRVERVAGRLEAKYMIEKQSYKALQASIQMQF